ncbi:MAG: tRNA pseudouridine(38-40) synthase TruA [Fusobacteriaceae bacterium]
MRNIKLTYAYDGTDFLGFQRQPNSRTVQGELEKLLSKYMKEPINLTSSGRTDRGVHAFMQVSNFLTNSTIPLKKIQLILNSSLPIDISITAAEEVDADFNSRFSAKKRTYKYFLTHEKNPFKNRFATYTFLKLDLESFLLILQPLIGKHDFRNFRLADSKNVNQVREIYSIIGSYEGGNICIEIKGSSFLKSQIRIIIGTALEIYKGNKPKNYLEILLNDLTYEYPKIVAEPNGLFLSNISY